MLSPIAAVIGISTAWASTHEGDVWTRIAGLLGTLEDGAAHSAVVPQPAIGPARLAVTASPAATATPVPSTPVEIPVLPVEELPMAPGTSPGRRGVARGPASGAPSVLAPDAPAARPSLPSDEASMLYAAAHHAHFVSRDPALALRAWDAFLAFAPDDPLALEARYNRALTLVRLDRRAEARGALEPFALGTYGSYRRREAQALIDALGP